MGLDSVFSAQTRPSCWVMIILLRAKPRPPPEAPSSWAASANPRKAPSAARVTGLSRIKASEDVKAGSAKPGLQSHRPQVKAVVALLDGNCCEFPFVVPDFKKALPAKIRPLTGNQFYVHNISNWLGDPDYLDSLPPSIQTGQSIEPTSHRIRAAVILVNNMVLPLVLLCKFSTLPICES